MGLTWPSVFVGEMAWQASMRVLVLAMFGKRMKA
jgi:hypothetical protein